MHDDIYHTTLTPTEEDIEEFKELLKKEHPDKQFSDSEARNQLRVFSTSFLFCGIAGAMKK